MIQMRWLKIVLLLLAFVPAAAYADPVRAPVTEATSVPPPATNDGFNDGYVSPSLKALSQLYWAIGKFDIADNYAIDGYLAINECDIFQKYYHNDLQWNAVREATRQKIMKDVSTYPTRFEIVMPVKLGRYDSEKRQFEVTPETSLHGAKKFEVAYNQEGAPVCGIRYDIKGYPRNIILMLNRPFDFKVLPVSPELADLFINDTQKQLDNTPLAEHVSNYQRNVYLRLKVHLTQYKDEVVQNGATRALVLGRLESFEIYADIEREKLLYRQDINDDKAYHHVHLETPAGVPATPIATPPSAVTTSPPPAPATTPAKVAIPTYQPPGDDEGIENATAPDAASQPAATTKP